MTKSLRLNLMGLFFLLVPVMAFAHVGHGIASGWLYGFMHPLLGVDHLCAMLAVGLWAKQMGGRAVYLVPLTFVSVMLLGGLIGMSGYQLPYVENGIMASLLVLGVLIAAAIRLPLYASTGLVGLFALFHGVTHGAEMPRDAGGFDYALGFVMATSVLHLAGIGLAGVFTLTGRSMWLRLVGVSIALFGSALFLAV